MSFQIAPTALFHDGSPCDAQAVKDSFTRFMELDTGPVLVIKRFKLTPEQMEVVDATTIAVTLDRRSPLVLPAMASLYGPFVVNPGMVEEHKTEENPWAHEWFLANASGTGLYYLEENLSTEHVIMTKFADHHGGWERPHFDRLLVRIVEEAATRRPLLETGDADGSANNVAPDDVEARSTNPDLKVEVYESTAVFWVIMNAPRLLTPAARPGFSYAFQYDDVVASAYRGLVTRTGPLASTVFGYDPDVLL